MPSQVNDFTIWRVDKVEQSDWNLKVNFDNFIYYKIYDIVRVFQERNTFIEEMVEINDYPETLSLKKWDIVVIDSYWSGNSSGILKITCEDNVMKIEWTKNKYFWTWLESKHSDKEDNKKLNDDKVLEKMNSIIWCENLSTFFDKGRQLQDLWGKNLMNYIYYTIWTILLLISIIAIFLKNRKSS